MKKFLVLLSMMVLLFSCGKGKNEKKTSDKKGGNNFSLNKNNVNEIQKYNEYIDIYNTLLRVDKSIDRYFEDAGVEEKVVKKETTHSILVDQSLIDRVKKVTESGGNQFKELNEASKAMLPVLEEMRPIAEEIKNYYGGKDYTSDNFAKGQELHTKFLAVTKKYDQVTKTFREAIKKKTSEHKEKEMEKFKKEGRKVGYSMMAYMKVAEEILDEIGNQKLNVANFTNADLSKLKHLHQELIKTSDELIKNIGDVKQLEKEGYKEHRFSMFKSSVNEFKASTATLIKRVEEKKKASDSEINTRFFAESSEGTPENIFKKFNDLVNNYNSAIR